MATSRSTLTTARFDEFQVDSSKRELLRSGVRVTIQEQPFQVLRLLLDADGKVVTREQLRDALWPGDTFVDFDHSVNTAIKKLRQALGDSPDSPKFIETLPKLGYRFIVPVEWVPEASGLEGLHIVVPMVRPEYEPEPPVVRPPTVKRHWKLNAAVAIAALAVVASLISLSDERSYFSRTRLGMLARRVVLGRSTPTQPTVIEQRLTANPEDTPITSTAISPDGKYLAYTDKTGFYLKQVDNGETHPVPLPKGFEPIAESWFPDSLHMVVAWVEDPTKLPSLWEISVLGGTPRKLADAGLCARVSPDGSTIAYLAVMSSQWEIWLLQADGGRAHRLVGGTEAEARDYFSPVAWAPDGRRAAYVRTTRIHHYDEVETKLEVADIHTGKVDVVLSHPGLGRAIGWADGDRLYYSVQEPAPNQNDFNLWRVQLDSQTAHPLGSATRVASGRGFTAGLSVTRDGKLLALRRQEYRGGVYLADVKEGGRRLGIPKRLTLDEREDFPTSWTPDSRAVMFFSARDGPRRIFKQNIDQTQPELLVGGDETLATPRLNPDATEMLYLAMPKPGETSQSVRIMRVPLSGGLSQLVLEAPSILNEQCAQLPSTLCIYTPQEPKRMRFITFDPVTGSGAEIVAARIEDSGGYNSWSLSPDGKYLASAKLGLKGVPEIRVFSIADSSKKTIAVPHTVGVGGVDWAADGKSVWVSVVTSNASGFGGYGARAIFNVGLNGKITENLENDSLWFDCAIPSPDGRRVALLGEHVSSNVWLLENL